LGIKAIRVKNLLSFEDIVVNEVKDINCIIGQNNVGKSNLLKLIAYFYDKLAGKAVIPPGLYSSYSTYGSISIIYDTTRIKRIVTSKVQNSPYQKHIYNVLFAGEPQGDIKMFAELLGKKQPENKENTASFELTLNINADDSVSWSTKDPKARAVINDLYPFFAIETRHIDLHDWDKLWLLISKLKSFNVNQLDTEDIVSYIDSAISESNHAYKDFIDKVQGIIKTSSYSYHEKVLNFVKVGLKGQGFNVDGEGLTAQSDGTNSHKYLELFLNLLITLTRTEYITPTVYIDEPEVGLHPKRNEALIFELHRIYKSYKSTRNDKVKGKYKTPYPRILIATHSPNIVKYVVRLFEQDQQILHFSKAKKAPTHVNVMNSQYDDVRFLNVFSDNEARLFFSHFILFVEGETELEIFGNLKLAEKFCLILI
jgi:predicted ATP-dependent endonuclease of OLD family